MRKLGIALALGLIPLAYNMGKITQFLRTHRSIVIPFPGREFVVLGRYPWHEHEDYVGDLYATTSAIYDEYEDYREVQELNDLLEES